MELDPVRGIRIHSSEAAGKSEYKGKLHYSSSLVCNKDFDKDPEKYLRQTNQTVDS